MSRKERFGKFVLLEELEATSVGTQYRAAKLGSAGLEKIVDLLRVSGSVSANADTAKTLMDQAKYAAQLQNPNILKIYGIGKVDGAYYISYEFVEGKSLRTVFNRCRSEGFPFSVDHTLLIASKICTAAEYAHGRKVDGGARYYHGYLTPSNVIVSHEGEVRLRGFGYWPAGLREAGGITDEEAIYLAPEQLSGGGDPRSDTFAIGAMLFEALTGQPLFQPDRKQDVAQRISQARLPGAAGDEDAIPRPIADILNKALAKDPGARYAETQEMRKAIDTLLFSGDFTPTTFNLAFFMHSLFREDIERESKVLKEEKEANYFDFLEDDKKAPKTETGPVPIPAPPATHTPAPIPTVTPLPTATPLPTSSSTGSLPLIPPPPKDHPIRTAPVPTPIPSHTPLPVAHREREREAPPEREPAGLPPREAAAGFTFHKGETKSKGPLFAGLAVVVLAAAAGGYFLLQNQTPAAPPPTAATPSPAPTLSPEQIAAEQRVKDLEAQLEKIKLDQEEAAKKAAEMARKRKEEELRSAGKAVDPAALAKAEDDARKKAEEESRKKAEAEQKRLEEARAVEQKRIEDEERRRAEDAARAAAAAAAATAAAQATAPPSAPSRSVEEGDLVAVTDPGVIPPKVEKEPSLVFPRAAFQAKVGGTVVVNALIDHKGSVVETQVLEKVEHPLGKFLEEAAIEHVRARKYRPATRDGVKVKVWLRVRVNFPTPR